MEQKPDFSGEYVLNRQTCTLAGGAATVQSAVIRFDHQEPRVRGEASFTFDNGTSFNFALDRVAVGREVLDGESPPASSLHWDGDVLVFLDRVDAVDPPMTMSWRYELDESRRRLTARERIRGGGRDQDNLWVFDRR
jgi:hypothetical protein